jgi:hypothetical protein
MALTKNYLIYELKERPMLRLNNLILKNFNFNVGDEIIVSYEENKITIKKEHERR